jgi:hypothetical protein
MDTPETPPPSPPESIVPKRFDARGLWAPRGVDPWAHRRGEPRTFAAFWFAFLFLAVAVLLGSAGSLGLIAVDVYRSVLRRLLVVLVVGVMVVWPMLRLSQERPRHPARSLLVDCLIMLPSLLVVILPQSARWMAAWPAPVCMCLFAWVCAWAMVVGGVVGLVLARPGGLEPSGALRTAAMVLIVAMVGAGPAAMITTGGAAASDVVWQIDHAMMLSPVTGVLEIVRDRSATGGPAMVVRAHWRWTGCVAGVGVVLCAWAWWRSRAGRGDATIGVNTPSNT